MRAGGDLPQEGWPFRVHRPHTARSQGYHDQSVLAQRSTGSSSSDPTGKDLREGDSGCETLSSTEDGDPFAWGQVFRRQTYDLGADGALVADHDYLDPAKETSVQGYLPKGVKHIKTIFHYVDGVELVHDERQSVDALGRMMTRGESGDKKLPSSRPSCLPSSEFWKLPAALQNELKAEQRKMNATRLQKYLDQIRDASAGVSGTAQPTPAPHGASTSASSSGQATTGASGAKGPKDDPPGVAAPAVRRSGHGDHVPHKGADTQYLQA